MQQIDYIGSLRKALDDSLYENNNVVLLGQDIANCGGVFRATSGLKNKYGSSRVIDMPLAENLIAGVTVGMATQGLIPIAEFQFMGFVYPALDQIINHASRLRNRTRSRLSCNCVFRIPYGAGIGAPEHHSESIESIFTHIPGLIVITPSRPSHVYSLLKAAVEVPDPVIFLEPIKLYRKSLETIDFNNYKKIAIGKAEVVTDGDDITIISWGSMVSESMASMHELKKIGISAEIIDIVTLKPIDKKTILRSVKKTGKCIIAHEACKTSGFGAEIAAIISEHAIDYLEAPIVRVTLRDIIIPYSKLEKVFLPNKSNITQTAIKLMEF